MRTPAEAWQEMLLGNERFISGAPEHPRQDVERRTVLAETQQEPDVAVFGCSDSRLAAEIIFDKGLGDLFVVRNAGQVISTSVLGSLEFAVGVLGVPLILVLGHDKCGAVGAAIASLDADSPQTTPHVRALIDRIAPAVERVARTAADAPVDPAAVGREHLRATVAGLLEQSELISEAVAEGRVAIVGANYRLAEGRAVADVIVGDI